MTDARVAPCLRLCDSPCCPWHRAAWPPSPHRPWAPARPRDRSANPDAAQGPRLSPMEGQGFAPPSHVAWPSSPQPSLPWPPWVWQQSPPCGVLKARDSQKMCASVSLSGRLGQHPRLYAQSCWSHWSPMCTGLEEAPGEPQRGHLLSVGVSALPHSCCPGGLCKRPAGSW